MKKYVKTREEMDSNILNIIPGSGSHHYDGIYFFLTLFAERRRKKRQKALKQVRSEKKKGNSSS